MAGPQTKAERLLSPERVREKVLRTLRLRRLPQEAEGDVERALDKVTLSSQRLFCFAALDAELPAGTALERLTVVYLLSAAVNLADDCADGDCDYLEPPLAPGVLFLLQSLALLPLSRSDLSQDTLGAASVALARAAAGQSLEVRKKTRSAEEYLEVADLIAGEQVAAYLRILWDGTRLEARASSLGRTLGRAGLIFTDLESQDPRLLTVEAAEQKRVFGALESALAELEEESSLRSMAEFVALARGTTI